MHNLTDEELELIYQNCSRFMKPYVRAKQMGPLFRGYIFKAAKQKMLLLQKEGEEIVGFCSMRELPTLKIISLDKIAVKEKKKGTGSLLIQEAIQIGKDKNLPIRLEVVASNQEAIQFYLRHGFQEIKRKWIGKNKTLELVVMMMDPQGELK